MHSSKVSARLITGVEKMNECSTWGLHNGEILQQVFFFPATRQTSAIIYWEFRCRLTRLKLTSKRWVVPLPQSFFFFYCNRNPQNSFCKCHTKCLIVVFEATAEIALANLFGSTRHMESRSRYRSASQGHWLQWTATLLQLRWGFRCLRLETYDH